MFKIDPSTNLDVETLPLILDEMHFEVFRVGYFWLHDFGFEWHFKIQVVMELEVHLMI